MTSSQFNGTASDAGGTMSTKTKAGEKKQQPKAESKKPKPPVSKSTKAPKPTESSTIETPIMMQPPEGTKHLHGNLYMIPFSSIRSPQNNPRLLTEQGRNDLLDREMSSQLRDSIKRNTLLNPLVCRWVIEDGVATPTIVGGDRRHRALDFLIKQKVEVVDPRSPRRAENGQFDSSSVTTADIAYEFVPCQVFNCSDDIDALTLAWAENKNRINLTDGHEIAQVMQLRENGATDAQIVEILQRNQKWLADTDRLIASLDSHTLTDLLEGRLERTAAVELAAIEDLAIRDSVRIEANEQAMASWSKKIARLRNKVDEANASIERAEGKAVLAMDDEEAEEAEDELTAARAESRNAQREIAENGNPVTTTSNVRDASRAKTGSTPKTANKRGPKGGSRKMRESKIQEGLEFFVNLVKSKGVPPDSSFKADVNALKLVANIFRDNIVSNNPDWMGTLRRFYSGR